MRLAKSVWENDTVARMAATSSPSCCAKSPRQRRRAGRSEDPGNAREAVLDSRQEIFLGANVGIALYPPIPSPRRASCHAEVAMLRTREEGGHFRYYTAKMNSAAAEALELEAALRRALERDELRPVLPAARGPAHRPHRRRGGAHPLADPSLGMCRP